MPTSPLAGKTAPKELLVDLSRLERDYFQRHPDIDDPIMDLLAAEITARTGKDPGEHFREMTSEFGTPITRASTQQPRRNRRRVCRGFPPKRSRNWNWPALRATMLQSAV